MGVDEKLAASCTAKYCERVKKVLLEGVTFKNSPSWCLHPLSCESLILNDDKGVQSLVLQNGDALDIGNAKNVLIANCFFLMRGR